MIDCWGILMRVAGIGLFVSVFAGCAGPFGSFDPIGAEHSSGCLRVYNMMYGTGVLCRSSAAGAMIEVTKDGDIRILHQGSK
jgi:hypothetical protein